MPIHALIPSAGSGTRLPGDSPKQYRRVAGVAVVAHTVRAFLDCGRVDTVTVVVAPGDARARGALPAHAAIDGLIHACENDAVGGLLALPLPDTLKQERGGDVARAAATLPRAGLWLAQTPQMFRLDTLLAALEQADPADITDEASAIERMGLQPRLVMGSGANFKITYPDDLRLAEALLASRAAGARSAA
jgi:2-C-methyl-D-erythritol 4-phosphate cytidylyltransferase